MTIGMYFDILVRTEPNQIEIAELIEISYIYIYIYVFRNLYFFNYHEIIIFI